MVSHQNQDQEKRKRIYQDGQVQTNNKNQKDQIGVSRAEDGGEGPQYVAHLIIDAVRDAVDRGPLMVQQRIHRAILEACPDLAGSWGPGYVARLVAEGEIPAADVAHALDDLRQQRYRARQGLAPPIRSESALACHLLKKTLARHGHTWRKQRRA